MLKNIKTPITIGLTLLLYFSSAHLILEGADNPIKSFGFKDFNQGTFGNSGSNLYVSKKGFVQVINKWDINSDGYNDVLISNDHDNDEVVDALIYWGAEGGPTSLLPDLWSDRPLSQVVLGLIDKKANVTRLPTFGGGRSAITDLNRDGYQDIIFCNYIHNYPGIRSAFIYWGSAQGFKPSNKTELPTRWAAGVAAADLNGDGYPDLVFANEGFEAGLEEISQSKGLESYVYWGSATGFNPDKPSLLQTRGATDVTIADFNKDGYSDLAFINNSPKAKEVQVFLGGATGYSNENVQSQPIPDPTSIHSADFNRDGYSDLIVTSSAKPQTISFASLRIGKQQTSAFAYILMGSAKGLSQQQNVQLPTFEARDSSIGDLNKDGYLDLAIANTSDGTTSAVPSFIYWGSEKGFSVQHRSELATLGASGVASADLNKDSYPDLIFANSNNGQMYDIPSYIYWGSPTGFAPYLRSNLQSFGAVGVNTADLNRDEKADVLLINQNSGKFGGLVKTNIFWGNPHHYYSTSSMSSLPGEGTYDTTVADLNDDSYNDIVICNSYSDVSYLYWGGPDGFSPGRREELPVGPVYVSSAADLNRDGYLDLFFTGNVKGKNIGTILWGSPEGLHKKTTFNLKTKRSSSNVVADLNRDGFLELIIPDEYFGVMQIFWGGPEGYSEARSWSKFVSGGSLELADLNGDSYLDFVVAGSFDSQRKSYNTKTRIYWGTQEGTPAAEAAVELEAYGAIECSIADLNRDGHLDLVFSNYMSDTTRSLPIFIYWGKEGGRYNNANRTDLPAESSAGIQTVDLNKDGYSDIIVHNHLKDGNHTINSYIYWNSPQGFDKDRRTELPTFGPHYSQTVDPGNLYTRKLEEEYISPAIRMSSAQHSYKLVWEGKEPHGTKLEFQVRSAKSRDLLSQAKWLGPEGDNSFYKVSNVRVSGIMSEDTWLQYRAIFTSPDAGEWPVLTRVEFY